MALITLLGHRGRNLQS